VAHPLLVLRYHPPSLRGRGCESLRATARGEEKEG
jgi:hypothetical protein